MADIFNFYIYDDRTIQFNLAEPIMLEDKNVTQFQFRIPKILNGLDMTAWSWWYVYLNASSEKYSAPLMLTDDPDDPDDYSIAMYTVDYGMSGSAGRVMFALEAIDTDSNTSEILHEWHTKTYSTDVIGTLQGNQIEFTESEIDVVTAAMQSMLEQVREMIEGGGGGGGTSDDITNASTVTGSTVSDALETLSGEIANKLTTAQINALNGMFQACAYAEDATAEYTAFCNAFGIATLASITAVYTQSGTVYDTDTLDSLKSDLVVTAHYSDSTTQTVTAYTLSGTLAEGTSTVTVSYSGKTTTFTVTVTHYSEYWLTLSIENDFVQGGCNDSAGGSYDYRTENALRCSYIAFDIPISSDYKYTFEYEGTASIGIPYYSEGVLDAVANHLSVSGYKTDKGWKSSGYSFTPEAGSVCMRITFNQGKTTLINNGTTELKIKREVAS